MEKLQIQPKTAFDSPNQQILIYQGVFYLQNKSERYEIKGKVYYKWAPTPGVTFKGHTDDKVDFRNNLGYNLIAKNNDLGFALLRL